MIRKICSFDDKYTIIHTDSLDEAIHLGVIEEKYDAQYVGEFCYHNPKRGWMNQPMALFYTKNKHPEGSNYLGVMIKYNILGERESIVLVNGICAVDKEWDAVLNKETNEILYSAYRHDYQTYGGMMADGGPEYTRKSLHPSVKLKIDKGEIQVVY